MSILTFIFFALSRNKNGIFFTKFLHLTGLGLQQEYNDVRGL